jgi:threonine dehydratase
VTRTRAGRSRAPATEALLTLPEIEAARAVVAPVARQTPIHESPSLSRLVGRPVLLKCEHLQRTGSFKIRGAYHHLATRPPEQLARGVVAASAGNHAQGVALAASLVGAHCVVFMPEGASLPKVQATRDYGAEVRLVGATLDESLAAARVFTAEEGAHFVPPFDDRAVMAGQATLGLELDEQTPPDTTFVVSVGGGGLAGGVAAALGHRRPGVRVVGVEAEGACAMREALDRGAPVTVGRLETMADGIRVGAVSELTLAHARELLADVVTVTEDAIARAVVLLLERAKAVVEPAGAAALAAVLDGLVGAPDGPVCVVLSGGNVDPILLGRIIRHGLTAAGRYVVLRVVIDDVPGSLARLLGSVAHMGLNVLEVEHHREGQRLAVDQVAVRLTLETRDPEHRDTVVARLARAGYSATRE